MVGIDGTGFGFGWHDGDMAMEPATAISVVVLEFVLDLVVVLELPGALSAISTDR